tara:strand:- start:192 stop:683 length:492 start_codon:yes stop_codon:yes gene_type:complete
MMNKMRGQMGPTEEEIIKYLLRQQKVRGPLGDVIDPEGIGSPEVPLDQLPEDITLPPEPNEDITQSQTINELSGTVPPDISNMSDSPIRNTSTHEMKNPDGTVTLMPGPSHEEYLNQEGLESVGADIPSEYELSRSKIPMTAKELKDRKDMMEAFGYPSRSRY